MATYHSKLKLPNWTGLLRTSASFPLHASPRRRPYLAPGSLNILSLAKSTNLCMRQVLTYQVAAGPG
ncbi:hypothetical protein M422DRAFT_36057 [Sphaerobolus stellatus SS14]|uniref:Uncharacterized protein n=1 Tax=Sphaerobolus stellatus (strain SS14) TaxID=990650 RepID=A0A0C9UBL6_SPHS4|nr:hypothetical protein M422DRAFT_36057 [Sphaerobolus stellatus SS14]